MHHNTHLEEQVEFKLTKTKHNNYEKNYASQFMRARKFFQ